MFGKRPSKKQISQPVKNQTGFGMTYFHFFRSLFSRAVSDSYQPASAAEGRLTGRNTDNGFGAEVVQRDSTVYASGGNKEERSAAASPGEVRKEPKNATAEISVDDSRRGSFRKCGSPGDLRYLFIGAVIAI